MSNSNEKTPHLICAKQACYILGFAPATFYRRLQDGSIEQGKKMGPRLKRWDEDYIISLAKNGLPPPKTPVMPDAAE